MHGRRTSSTRGEAGTGRAIVLWVENTIQLQPQTVRPGSAAREASKNKDPRKKGVVLSR